jgi:hypothetical protein
MFKFGILLIAIFLFNNYANAQAFGVQMGDSVLKYGGTATEHKNEYRIRVPIPNSEFDFYIAKATSQTGICSVLGLGKTHENDSYGIDIRSTYEHLQDAMTAKYGLFKSYDFLSAGSIWKNPNDSAMAFYKHEKHLASFWSSEYSSINLGNLESIGLIVHALNSSDTYLNLKYEFKNINKCNEIMDSNDNAGL